MLTKERGLQSVQQALDLAEKLDFLDVQLLRKFYACGREFPNDTLPHCFPLLYKEMKDAKQIKIGREALRKRLDNLVKLNLLKKIHHSNPAIYAPLPEKAQFVKALIARFFLIHGLKEFL